VQVCGDEEGVEVRFGPGERERLEAVIGSGNSRQKHVWRARIGTAERQWGWHRDDPAPNRQSKPAIRGWQARFMAEGVDGLLHDATRPSRKTSLTAATIERVVEMTLGEPPGEATHWTGQAMAKAAGISLRSVQRIWAAHGLKPHRVRRFKLSQAAINRFLHETNHDPKPFIWTADPDAIIEKVRRGQHVLASIH
jgi:Homeodomain-like domain